MRTKCQSKQRIGRKPINQSSNFPGKTTRKLPRLQAATIRKNAEAFSVTGDSIILHIIDKPNSWCLRANRHAHKMPKQSAQWKEANPGHNFSQNSQA
jgi:hypothetical protein